ncbi:MAG: hypothetical protein ABR548_12500 [Actinomycetota bacterium]|nr:hypothetical protein [Actinomycetota bacterium]
MLGFQLLEWTFMGLLGLMTVIIGFFSVVVVVRIVEPRGLKALLLKLAGRDTPGFQNRR